MRSVWIPAVALLCLFVLGLCTAHAENDEELWIPETDFKDFFPALGHNYTKGLFNTRNIMPMMTGALGASLIVPWDKEGSEKISPYSEEVEEVGQILGGPVILAAVGGSLVVAPFTENKKFRAFSFDLAQAYIINVSIVQATKYIVGRARPNGEDSTSFPSGHSADSFLMATMINHYYGWKAGIPAYCLAGLVAFSRVEKKKHFPSDVIFGAAIGYTMAKMTVREHAAQSTQKISWLPFLGRHEMGLSVTWEF